MITIDAVTARIAAEMLDLAGNEFSNHGCNDYQMEATEENLAFVLRMIAASDYPEDKPHIYKGKIMTMDWMVMAYCERVLRGEVPEPTKEGGAG